MEQLVRDRRDAPDADTSVALLDAAEQEEALRILVNQALLTRRAWSMRLAAIAMNRFVASPSDGSVSNVSELFFELADGVAEFNDDAALRTCLNAMKWLNESGRLRPLKVRDRQSALELLWRGLGSDLYNTRESGLDTLTSIHDFGDLVELLGDDGAEELRRRIQEARSEAGGEVADDLESAKSVLP
jgi:hypothetical protein